MKETFLFYADSGRKKTRTGVLCFPKPLVLLDWEGGTTSLRSDLEERDRPEYLPERYIAYHCKTEPFTGPVYVLRYNTSERAQYFNSLEDIQQLKALVPKIQPKTVMGDSLTELYKLCQIYTTGLPMNLKAQEKLSPDEKRELELGMTPVIGLEDWNPISERLRQIVRSLRDFRNLGAFVVVTALEYIETEGFGTPNPVQTKGLPNLPGKLRSEIPGMFDEWWRFAPAKRTLEDKTVQSFDGAFTVQRGLWLAKSRLNLPEVIDLAKVASIIQRLDNHERRNTHEQ